MPEIYPSVSIRNKQKWIKIALEFDKKRRKIYKELRRLDKLENIEFLDQT